MKWGLFQRIKKAINGDNMNFEFERKMRSANVHGLRASLLRHRVAEGKKKLALMKKIRIEKKPYTAEMALINRNIKEIKRALGKLKGK